MKRKYFHPFGAQQVESVGETLEASAVCNWQTLTHLHDETLFTLTLGILSNFELLQIASFCCVFID